MNYKREHPLQIEARIINKSTNDSEYFNSIEHYEDLIFLHLGNDYVYYRYELLLERLKIEVKYNVQRNKS